MIKFVLNDEIFYFYIVDVKAHSWNDLENRYNKNSSIKLGKKYDCEESTFRTSSIKIKAKKV